MSSASTIRLDDDQLAALVDLRKLDAKPATPALALSVEQACAALSVSWETWRAHIEPEVKIVRLGRRKLIAVTELQRWLNDHAEAVQ